MVIAARAVSRARALPGPLRLFLMIILAVLPSAGAAAQTVYRSVDENGVVSFSDQPPESGSAQRIHIETPTVADDPQLEARLAAIRETTDRMAADRREREKHRAGLRAARADPPPANAPPANAPGSAAAESRGGAFWPAYGGAYGPLWPRPPLRPHPPLRPRPHPGPRPVPLPAAAPPGWSVMQPGNAQLMRPARSSRP